MSINRWNWDPSVDMSPSDEGCYVLYSDHERVISEKLEAMQGYVDAFYELAGMMGMCAQSSSPKEVWDAQMRPKLENLFDGKNSCSGFQWHPIDSAPKDGRNILLDYPRWAQRAMPGRWDKSENVWRLIGLGCPWTQPTKWHPLPELPEVSDGQ